MNGYMTIPIELVVVFATAVLGAFGWIISTVISAFKKNTDAFNSINESIQEIRLWITQKDTSDKYEQKECDVLHKSVNSRFENHEKRIKKLEEK